MEIKNQKQSIGREYLSRYKAVLDNMDESYVELDPAGNIIFFNNTLCAALGYSTGELTGMNYKQYVALEHIESVYRFFNELYLTGIPGKLMDYEVITKDGSRRVFEASATLIRDSLGKPIKFRTVSRDITDRKRAEEELRKSEERYRSIIENIEDGYFELDLAGNMTFFNTAMCRIANVSPKELLGLNNREYTSPETAKEMLRVFGEIYRTGKPVRSKDYEIIWKDGNRRAIELSASLIRDKKENPLGFRGIVRDITDRKIWENSLRESEEKYRSILENIQEGYFEVDLAGKLVFFNDVLCNLSGYSRDELLNISDMGYLTPESKISLQKVFGEIYRTGNPSGIVDYDIVSKDGRIFNAELSASLMRDKKGKPIGFRAVARDITEQKKIYRSLQESEEKYRTILESIEDGYFEVDLAGNFTFFNNALLKIAALSSEELLGMNYIDYTSPETARDMYNYFRKIYRTKESARIMDYEILSKDGTKRICELSTVLMRDSEGKAIGFRGIARDVTDRVQAEKMYKTVADKSFAGVYIIQKGIFRYINSNAASYTGYTPEELIGKNTMIIVYPDDRETLKQQSLEVIKGVRKSPYEFRMITRDGGIRWIIETITPIVFQGEPALLGNAMDITERKQAEQAINNNFKRLRKALGATIQAMAVTVEARDPYTAGHQRSVADLARSIATEMGLTAEQIDGIRMAATIHDIGKISIPAEILSKPTQLKELEFRLIKTHSQAGYDILKDIEFPWPIARMVLEHHERTNGTGYPQGLKGEQTLIESRIIVVADVVEAMGAHRPYRPSVGLDLALDEITKNRGILYDPEVVDACLRLFHTKGYKLIQV